MAAAGLLKAAHHTYERFSLNCGGYFKKEKPLQWFEYDDLGVNKGFGFVEAGELCHSNLPDTCGTPRVLLLDEQRGMWIQLHDDVALMSLDRGDSWFRFTPMQGCDSAGTLHQAGEYDEISSSKVPSAHVRGNQTCWVGQGQNDNYINVINQSRTFVAGRKLSESYLTSVVEMKQTPVSFPRLKLQTINPVDVAEGNLDSILYQYSEDIGHMYTYSCGLAVKNITTPPQASLVRHPFADAAFNGCLFMWDSIFMLEFWRWNPENFAAQRGLDNFYLLQVEDGYICREISVEGRFKWHPTHPCGTGPNLFAWSELRHFRATLDHVRIRAVLPHVAAYHRWTRANRSWRDGSYWNTGYGSGMDNQPRRPPLQSGVDCGGDTDFASHWHMSWVDATAQALLSAVCILQLVQAADEQQHTTAVHTAAPAGSIGGVDDLQTEAHALAGWLSTQAWHEEGSWYCDVDRCGNTTGIKSAAGWWAVLALADYATWCESVQMPPQVDTVQAQERAACMVAHLSNPETFGRHHMVPSLSADTKGFDASAGYWRGGVWPPTTYLAVLACEASGLVHGVEQVTASHLKNCAEVFATTGSVWENYAPDSSAPGNPARQDFVGWGGLGPIALLLQVVCGLQWDAASRHLTIAPCHTQGYSLSELQLKSGHALFEVDISVTAAGTEQGEGQAVSVAVRVLRGGDSQAVDGGFTHSFRKFIA